MGVAQGKELLIKIGDGADPELFAFPCGLNSRGFQREAATNDFEIIDCDDPDAPPWIERVISSFSSSISGGGYLETESIDAWHEFFGKSKNVQIVVPGVGTFQGEYICTSLNIEGEHNGKASIDTTLQSNGPVTLLP